MLVYHPANFGKFGGPKHCFVRDIVTLVYHMISQDHAIKGSCDFIYKSQSW